MCSKQELMFYDFKKKKTNDKGTFGIIYPLAAALLKSSYMHVHRSLAITANAVGWDHPLVATAYMNLGTVEMHRSNYNKGEDWSRKAITIYEVQILKYVRRQMKSKYKFYLNEYFGTLFSE